MASDGYKLDDLARAAGTSPRTVRYYVQRGLLPAPAFRGKDTAYGEEHLVRLRAIRRLQEAYLPLDAIAAELARRSLAEIERIADGRELPTGAAAPAPAAPGGHPYRGHARPPRASIEAAPAFRRVALAPGVELAIADDAPAESRRLVEKILETFEPMSNVKEGA